MVTVQRGLHIVVCLWTQADRSGNGRNTFHGRKLSIQNGKVADYDMAELLPVAAWLTDKYTSRESSSVTYETAAVLMEAVCYCIQECFSGNPYGVTSPEKAWGPGRLMIKDIRR